MSLNQIVLVAKEHNKTTQHINFINRIILDMYSILNKKEVC